jgi:hypothetical protein
VTGLAAGHADSTDLLVGVVTASSGTLSGTALLTLASDGTGIDGLGTTALGSQTISVSGTVDNYAVAAFQDPGGPQITGGGTSFVLNLGTVTEGGAALSATLGVLNAATGLADLLGGSISSAGASGFSNSGFGAYSGLGAGQGEQAQMVSLATNAVGTFSETVVLTASGSNASGYSGALPSETLTVTGTVTSAGPTVYTLTGGPQTIVGANGGDLFIAGPGTLNSRDNLTGGTGANVLQLTGGGSFDLNAPKTLANIQTVTAYEGQAPAAPGGVDTRQTVLLRDGASETVNVVSSTPAGGNANPETIAIYGGTGADVINLGQGSDLVVLGSKTESVNGGGGTALVQATAAFAGAQVIGGSGQTTLELTTGGTAALNANTTQVTVQLDQATNLALSGMGFISAIGEVSGNTITAKAAGQTLGGMAGGDTLTGFSGFGDTFSGTAAGLLGDMIKGFGGNDLIDLTNVAFGVSGPSLSYTGNATKGTLGVSDGTHAASLTMFGNFSQSHFHVATDGHSGTLVSYS